MRNEGPAAARSPGRGRSRRDNRRLSRGLAAHHHEEEAGRLVPGHRPAVGDRPRVDDAVTGTELDRQPTGELQVEAPLEQVEHDIARVLEPDVEVLGGPATYS